MAMSPGLLLLIGIILGVAGLAHVFGVANLFKKKKAGVLAGVIFTSVGLLGILGSVGTLPLSELPILGGIFPATTLAAGVGSPGTGPTGSVSLGASCPDDGDTSFTLDVQNIANKTGSEAFDVTYSLFKILDDGSLQKVAEPTDTTSPSATLVDCGYRYVAKVQATDAASGDNSRIKQILSGPGTINSDGDLEFDAASSNVAIIAGIEQQATLEARMYSNFDSAFMFDSSDASATDYETDGVTFTSTTDNATAYTESNGLDFTLGVRAVQSDTNWNDKGWVILLEAPTNVWDTPTIRVNGQKLSDAKGSLSVDEARAWSGYEYVYESNVDIYDAGDGAEIDWVMSLLSGVSSASADPELDIGARGNYESINGIDVKSAGVKDDSSGTVVRSLFDVTVDVTA